jgi:hypothetical protein
LKFEKSQGLLLVGDITLGAGDIADCRTGGHLFGRLVNSHMPLVCGIVRPQLNMYVYIYEIGQTKV